MPRILAALAACFCLSGCMGVGLAVPAAEVAACVLADVCLGAR
jgi:hypothetical protein